jgi:hypothetical protein
MSTRLVSIDVHRRGEHSSSRQMAVKSSRSPWRVDRYAHSSLTLSSGGLPHAAYGGTTNQEGTMSPATQNPGLRRAITLAVVVG